MERELIARPLAWLVWGANARLLYDSLQAISNAPADGSILDVPCGGGIAFRAVRESFRGRYVAVDISDGMLRRARRRARKLGLSRIEFIQADARQLPLEDASFDLCVCMSGLHCIDEPQAALREFARCMRGGGQLVGDVAVCGSGRRFDSLIALYQRRGVFGPVGTPAQLERDLGDAGFEPVQLTVSGAVAFFTATRS